MKLLSDLQTQTNLHFPLFGAVLFLVCAQLAGCGNSGGPGGNAIPAPVVEAPVPRALCGPGSNPESGLADRATSHPSTTAARKSRPLACTGSASASAVGIMTATGCRIASG